jgi:hypothetical protein
MSDNTEPVDVPEAPMEGGKRNKWLTHVKKTLRANKGKSFKAVLKMAKKTYKGGAALSPLPLSGGGALSPLPLSGGRKTRKTRKSRKSGRKH